MGGPRQNWSLAVSHEQGWPDGPKRKYRCWRWLRVEILELGIEVRDVRELSGLVIRSTPAWMKKVQESGQYGELVEPVVEVTYWLNSKETEEVEDYQNLLSLEWELRLGKLDGHSLPCELDVWNLIPQHEFFRTEPETEEELAVFAQGEPVLRIMARAEVATALVEMERCGDDPLPLARQRLHAAVGGLDMPRETLFWESNYTSMPEHQAVKEPGWRSTVKFDTSA